MSRNIAYRRCSTDEDKQSVNRQLMDRTFDLEFTEYASGSNEENRPEFQKMLSIVKGGDHIWFQEISRAGRNTSQLLTTVQNLMEKGITIHFVSEGLQFTNNPDNLMQAAISKMLLSMLSAVNEMQLAQGRVAVKQGLVKPKREGRLEKKDPNCQWHKTFQANRANHTKTKRKEASRQRMQPVVTLVTDMISFSNNSLTLDAIADKLNERNITTATGKPWKKQNVSGFIKMYNIKR
jgi:DNA invertase Pin-like site-specific DNA recombinase